jgi:polyisoprenoid-binding protein YceI
VPLKPLDRSPFFAVIPAGIAVAGALARWLVQGSGNVYTTLSKRFYEPDPDLEWRLADARPMWIGLEVIGILAGITSAIAVAAYVIRRVEAKRGRRWTWPRIATLALAIGMWAVPIVVFASGGAPANAVEMLPAGKTAAAPTSGFEGGLGLPSGTYRASAGSAITARLEAGHETFDARFASDVAGEWTGDPARLDGAHRAAFSVKAASVDTGIALRSQHAREDYLHADKFPEVGFTLERVVAARQDAPDTVAFRATGALALMGASIPAEITGSARALDAAAATRLGVPSGRAAFVVRADTAISIKASPLAVDADSFDVDRVPIRVDLVLVKTE